MNNLITNNQTTNFYNHITKLLLESKSFIFNVAFINFSGVQLLLDVFSKLENKNIKDIKREFGETKEGFINTLESYSKTIVNPFNLQNNKDYFKNVGETIQNTEELGINLYKGVGSGLKFTGDIAKSAKDFYTLGEKLYKLSENPDVKKSMDKIVDMTIPIIKS